MCLLAFAYKTQADSPLIVTSNRDEFYPRPTLPMHWWSDAPILAGKDLDAGGTWLGLSRIGRFAAVTNYRYVDENGVMESKPLSRGQLVTDFLLSESDASTWAYALGSSASSYGGFNLLLYDGDNLVYLNNFENLAPQTLEPGIYALSNNRLDSPWPKVDHAREQLAELIENIELDEQHLETIMATLSLQKTYAPELLPNTGVPQDWETLLSSPFIVADGYGTRASAAVIISAGGQIAVAEQTYEAGETLGSQTFSFSACDR
jgi:uncharacterized protein with NRDE domain